MTFSAYIGLFSAYSLVRYKIRVYKGDCSEYVLESSTYRGGLLGGSRTLVSETNEPREITYTLMGLIVQAAQAVAWIALAAWLGTKLFAR